MGRASSKECLVFFIRQRKAYNYFFLRGIWNFFHGEVLGLFWRATKQHKFVKIFRYISYSMVKKIPFLKGNLSICEYPIDILYTFWDWLVHPGLRFELNNFCHVLTGAWTDPCTSQVVLCKLPSRINLWVLNKIVWEIISLSVVVSSLIDNISSKNNPELETTASKLNLHRVGKYTKNLLIAPEIFSCKIVFPYLFQNKYDIH